MVDPIFTARLELRPMTLRIVLAVLEGRPRREIEALVGAEMPWTWPSRALVEQVFKASLEAIRAEPDARLWGDRLVVMKEPEGQPRVLGSIIFDGQPRGGTCSVAYGIEDSSQGKGYATEALSATIDWALTQPECERVRASTSAWHKASLRVLEKVGMKRIGEHEDPELGKMLDYERSRG